ncbi:S10 family serine carboxypeptidase-like protein [Croceicoccus hydrothermalis]|uniref:S10 family serine carboxypeptidase-like protein n=1 Tax=Croceicoccus hydrothermalis TaxID=2867964 RepID=UPI001EFB9837|nr:peptidase S10 [Croceicoccus hydrothermalis]
MKMLHTMLRFAPVALMAGMVPALPAAAQQSDRPMPPAFLRAMEPMVERPEPSAHVITTGHRGRFANRPVAYDAIVTETPVANAAGEVAAVVVTYAYVAKNAGDPGTRPVLFFFNGGPGASSSPLHMQAFGPRVVRDGDAGATLVNNPHSLLDTADLVFIDPPGTGASMPVAGVDASSLFSVDGDAAAVAQVVQQWRVDNGRTGSPFALVGESYGTARAAAMLHSAAEAELPLPDGVALLSMSLGDTAAPVISDMAMLPTLAAVNWYHHPSRRDGQSVVDRYNSALDFAQGEYAKALIRWQVMDAPARAAVAERMARLIGIPAAKLLASDLRIDKTTFMLSLLADRGLRTGQLDARVTRPIADSNFQPPFDDPSMTLGTSTSATLESYLAEELEYRLPSAYRSLNLGINFKWDWGENESYRSRRFAPLIAEALERRPDMAIFTAGGLYDITTPTYAGIFALDHAGIARDRRTTRLYAAGHSVFEDEGELARMSADLREWAHTLGRSGDAR